MQYYYLERPNPHNADVLAGSSYTPKYRMYVQPLPVHRLRNPEPYSLENVSWVLLGPLSILCIHCSLASGDVCI
jgi:hypothetical protein